MSVQTTQEYMQAIHDRYRGKDRYNRGQLCERHGHQTPAQVRARLLERAA